MSRQRIDEENQWRIRGISELSPRILEYVRQIWFWREHEAKVADIPSFKIMNNHLLIELAIWAALNPGRIIEKGNITLVKSQILILHEINLPEYHSSADNQYYSDGKLHNY